MPTDPVGYTLLVVTTYDDGHTDQWTYDRPGMDPTTAHDQLARRWRAAGYTFTRDRKALQLARRITSQPELGPYADTITHVPWQSPTCG